MALRVVPVDGTRKSVFSVSYVLNGEPQTKECSSRADLFATVKGAEMFGISDLAIVRTVSQAVTVKRPSK